VSPQRLDPPKDLEAEEGALGAAMLSAEALEVVLGRLREDDFYRPAHRAIYQAVARLHGRQQPVDATTVGSELKRRGGWPMWAERRSCTAW
jgi:replicative DNA helicase